ncbi:MAG: SAM-dependent methyltransferase [Bacteroidota bacterium]
MENKSYLIEELKPFADSLIWQLSRDYYQQTGLDAWSSGAVPHHVTSNARVGKTYAELIFAFLKDLATKGQSQETVYIVELGAGHGRLAFHILKHLERLIAEQDLSLPAFCYIISDIVEDNLAFFEEHHQFQAYLQRGVLDVAYFDAVVSEELVLRYAQKTLQTASLEQPVLAIGNYFFDSLPNDLFRVDNKKIHRSGLRLEMSEDPQDMGVANLLKYLSIHCEDLPPSAFQYQNKDWNTLLEVYRQKLTQTYLFFPRVGLTCLEHLSALSTSGLLLLTMDKGYQHIKELDRIHQPDMVIHGSMSFAVNYHAFRSICEQEGGLVYFPDFSNPNLQMGCMLFLKDGETYLQTKAAYQHQVNDFGPSDFNGFKKFAYKHIETITLPEVIGLIRLGAYDATLFVNFLPRLKVLLQRITYSERLLLAQSMHAVWDTYFSINEGDDLAFEMAGIFYKLGYYQDALDYFAHSVQEYGSTPDAYYNQILCYYQLRQDVLFVQTIKRS